MTFAIVYIVGATLTGGTVAALMERHRYSDRVESFAFGGLCAIFWPIVAALGAFALLAAVGYRLVKAHVDTAADAYDDLTRGDTPYLGKGSDLNYSTWLANRRNTEEPTDG